MMNFEDIGISLGIRLSWALHYAAMEGDDRALEDTWRELRDHARHLDEENPVRLAVGIVGEVIGLDPHLGRPHDDALYDPVKLSDRLAHLDPDGEIRAGGGA